jgi:hypothetical protein
MTCLYLFIEAQWSVLGVETVAIAGIAIADIAVSYH